MIQDDVAVAGRGPTCIFRHKVADADVESHEVHVAVAVDNAARQETVAAVAVGLAEVAFRGDLDCVALGLPPLALAPARGLLQARLVRTQRWGMSGERGTPLCRQAV